MLQKFLKYMYLCSWIVKSLYLLDKRSVMIYSYMSETIGISWWYEKQGCNSLHTYHVELPSSPLSQMVCFGAVHKDVKHTVPHFFIST